jgi:hypothetical protein
MRRGWGVRGGSAGVGVGIEAGLGSGSGFGFGSRHFGGMVGGRIGVLARLLRGRNKALRR